MLLTVLLGAVFALAASASDGRVPVYEATTISTAGSYYLTQEISGSITITVSDVFLDLNGFTVGGTVTIATSGTVNRTRVANGKVTGDVSASSTSGILLNDLHVAGQIVLVTCYKATVDRCTATQITLTGCLSSRVAGCTTSKGMGIRLAPNAASQVCKDVEVADCTVVASTSQGISLEGASGCSVVRNVIQGSTQYGINMIPNGPTVFATGNRIAENTISGNALGGINMNQSYANQVTLNVVTANGTDAPGSSGGIYLATSSGNEVSHNTVAGNGATGITLAINSAYNNVLYNTVNTNGSVASPAAGILVSGNQNSIDWNSSHFNTQYGIQVIGTGNVLSHNRALGNTAGGYNVVIPANTMVEYSGPVATAYPTNF